MKPFIVFDTETTGLGGDAEICEIAIMDQDGRVLLDTLVQPKKRIPEDAIAIHGIDNDMVTSAPTWPEISYEVGRIFSTAPQIYAYNAQFDVRMLLQSGWYGMTPMVRCAMAEVVQRLTVASPHFSLKHAARRFGISFDGLTPHRALSDCAVTVDIIRCMHGAMPIATKIHAGGRK